MSKDELIENFIRNISSLGNTKVLKNERYGKNEQYILLEGEPAVIKAIKSKLDVTDIKTATTANRIGIYLGDALFNTYEWLQNTSTEKKRMNDKQEKQLVEDVGNIDVNKHKGIKAGDEVWLPTMKDEDGRMGSYGIINRIANNGEYGITLAGTGEDVIRKITDFEHSPRKVVKKNKSIIGRTIRVQDVAGGSKWPDTTIKGITDNNGFKIATPVEGNNIMHLQNDTELNKFLNGDWGWIHNGEVRVRLLIEGKKVLWASHVVCINDKTGEPYTIANHNQISDDVIYSGNEERCMAFEKDMREDFENDNK